VNTLLGTVLWSTYAYSSTYLESVIPTHPIIIAATSGALAGATQALAAAPAENVRLVLEGVEGAGPVKTLLGHAHAHAPNSSQAASSAGWTSAWKEVFRGRDPIVHAHSREELRAVSQWVKEVRGMAGRGWDGWGWGVGKDSAGAVPFQFIFRVFFCIFRFSFFLSFFFWELFPPGFALFFSIFELSRKLANGASGRVVSEFEQWHIRLDKDATPMTEKAKKTAARTVHGVTLVAGGVVAGFGYEMVCRPFDNTRRLVYLDDQHKRAESIASHIKPVRPRHETRIHVVGRVVLGKLNEDGPASFFRNPQPTVHASTGPNTWLYAGLRTLSRLGPWGVGFLVWEFMGGGLPQLGG